MLSVMPGWALANLCKRGTNHFEANEGAAQTFSARLSTCPRRRSTPLVIRSMPSCRSGNPASAAAVSASPRARRWKSFVPSCSSSERICWLMAAGVTFSSTAARAKLR